MCPTNLRALTESASIATRLVSTTGSLRSETVVRGTSLRFRSSEKGAVRTQADTPRPVVFGGGAREVWTRRTVKSWVISSIDRLWKELASRVVVRQKAVCWATQRSNGGEPSQARPGLVALGGIYRLARFAAGVQWAPSGRRTTLTVFRMTVRSLVSDQFST